MLSINIIRNSLLLLFVFLVSCNDIIEYSPYDVDIKNEQLNSNYKGALSQLDFTAEDTVVFGLMSDPHYYYDKLSKAVKHINSQNNLAFIVVCGDITDSGLAREYEYYRNQIKNLKVPCFSLIGNHDYLSNGEKVFSRMFGPTNYTFQYGGYNFIAFDDVVWENDNSQPNFEWLKNTISSNDNKNIIFTHIPPWTDQFTDDYRKKYYDATSHPSVLINIYGHQHHYQDTVIQQKRHFVTEAVFEQEYYLVKLAGNNVSIETIHF